jgi:DNA-binding PadR family transcriptional regulator
MSLRHGLLGLLSLKPYTGYELNKEFEQAMKYIWQTKTTQIYIEQHGAKGLAC